MAQILQVASVQILLFMLEKGEVRHSDLSGMMKSRGTLSLSLRDLQEEGLINRKVLDTKPIQSLYTLSDKGTLVAQKLRDVRAIVNKL